jgi:hypothetical protein
MIVAIKGIIFVFYWLCVCVRERECEREREWEREWERVREREWERVRERERESMIGNSKVWNYCLFLDPIEFFAVLKTGSHEMDKILTQTFRHSFLHLYCRLSYQFGSKGSFIKSNAITLNYNLSIVYKQIKIK